MASIWKASYHGLSNMESLMNHTMDARKWCDCGFIMIYHDLSNMESLMNQTEGRWKISSPLKDGEKKFYRSTTIWGFTWIHEKNGVFKYVSMGKNMTHDWIVHDSTQKNPIPDWFDTPVSKKVPQNKQIPTELSTTSVSGQVFIVGVDCFTFCYFIFWFLFSWGWTC